MALPHPQVALRIFRNKTATQVDKLNKPYNPKLKAKGPADVVTRYKITEVTPRMIAYAAVQVQSHYPQCSSKTTLTSSPTQQTYIGLSSLPSWGPIDGTFSLIHLYHLIVKTLSDNTDEWVAQTIGWWKR